MLNSHLNIIIKIKTQSTLKDTKKEKKRGKVFAWFAEKFMIKETPAYVAQMNAGRYIKKRKRPTPKR